MRQPPQVVLLAGPNGAGESTAAAAAIGRSIVDEFVNADVIAAELAPGEPERAAFEAGRRALVRIDTLIASRASFAFETTLAARSYARWIKRASEAGYLVRLVFFWLPTADMAVERVAQRAETGGHHIPEDVIRRRYAAGIRNFFGPYRDLADEWAVYDSSTTSPARVAGGERGRTTHVTSPGGWREIRRSGGID